MRAQADFWLAIAQGSIIGAAGLIPGASGGVLAVAMGIYRPIVDAIPKKASASCCPMASAWSLVSWSRRGASSGYWNVISPH